MTHQPLSLPRKLGYGIGDTACNLFFGMAALYLLFYYTDVLRLSPAVAGAIYAGAMFWDAIIDPVMGYVASRTRTRWGSYRPYVVLGSLPLAGAFTIMFIPTGLSGGALIGYTLAAHVLFRTAYTVVSMPYLSLAAVMTSDSADRGSLAGIRTLCAATGSMFVAFFTLKLVAQFGQGDQLAGFFRVSLLFGTMAVVLLVGAFLATREDVTTHEDHLPRIGELLVMLKANRVFWLIGGAMFLGSVASILFVKCVPYYFKYVVGREDLIGPALAAVTGMLMVSTIGWMALMRQTSKRVVSLSGSAVGLVGYAALWLTPATQPTLVLLCFGLLGIAAGAGTVAGWAMIPDTVEYGQFKTGVRAEGVIYGLISFVQKASLGVGVGVTGELLELIGYHANQPQTAATIAGLRAVMVVIPAALGAIGAALIWFYPLDTRLHGRLVRAIARRDRARLAPRR